MSFPRTETELEAQGYVFENTGRCRACNAEKDRRQAAKDEGMCQKCRKRIAMPKRTICGYCAELVDEYRDRRKARLAGRQE